MADILKNYFGDKNPEIEYQKYENDDPFKDIPPSLLCAKDIDLYIKATGLVDPYYPERLKSASYEVLFEGDVIYWDDNNKECREPINKGDRFELRKNAIVFVYTKTKFRLPNYIGLRFNLRINLVHKGLLLGTGPLIDPGFKGQLLVPLHNMTANDYVLVGGEGFFWVEFTKTTGVGKFPKEKIERTPSDYFREANQNRPIRSSIPDAVQQAMVYAENANKSADKTSKDMVELEKKVRRYSFWGGIAVGITIIAILISMTMLALTINSTWSDYKDKLEKATKELNMHNELKKEVEIIQNDLDSLKKQNNVIQDKKSKKQK
jgi:deoxycytidine triphosphate deaminase